MTTRLCLLPLMLATACTTIYTSPADQDGDHQPAPKPGDPKPSDPKPDDPDPQPTEPGDPHVVFVTSALYQGGYLDGLAGADAACAKQATAAGLPGTFKAWLSDDTISAADRLSHATGPYVLVNDTRVANDWADLTHADLQHAINVDETGAILGPPSDPMLGAPVWTGTEFDGVAAHESGSIGNNCGNWKDLHAYGLSGDRSGVTQDWSIRIGLPCTFKAALYCLEQ